MNYVYYVLEIRAWGRHPKGVSKVWRPLYDRGFHWRWMALSSALAAFVNTYLPKKFELRLVQITEID
jgi:hypothetical protein